MSLGDRSPAIDRCSGDGIKSNDYYICLEAEPAAGAGEATTEEQGACHRPWSDRNLQENK